MTPHYRDKRIRRLRSAHGWKGYGIYIALLNMLHEENDQSLDADYKILGCDLGVPTKVVRSIVEDFGLFVLDVVDGRKQFWDGASSTPHHLQETIPIASPSLCDKSELSDAQRRQRKQAGQRSACCSC